MGIIAGYAVIPVYTHPHCMAQRYSSSKKRDHCKIFKSVYEYDNLTMPVSVKFLHEHTSL